MEKRDDRDMLGWLDKAISEGADEGAREADLRTLYGFAVLKAMSQTNRNPLSEADAERLEITETAVRVIADSYGWAGGER